MNERSSLPNADEEILAAFVSDLERLGEEIIDDWKRRYPHLAHQIDEIIRLQDAIGDTRHHSEPSVPEYLGDFRMIRCIARGGMGEVWEAEQERLCKRRVAVKIILRGRISHAARKRFLVEQEVLAKLHQTHIVPIFAAGDEGQLQYFAMPFIDGAALNHVVHAVRLQEEAQAGNKTPTLAEWAALLALGAQQAPQPSTAAPANLDGAAESPGSQSLNGPTTQSKAANIRLSMEYFRSVAQVMSDVAEAISHAHDAGIIHRDLKPSNIMVERPGKEKTEGKCWIIDFGLAKYLDKQPGPAVAATTDGAGVLTHGPVGTPSYMAPEQFEGVADARTDVWGLGATLYELLTLRRCFEAPTFAEVRAQIEAGEPPTPPPGIPPDLLAISYKAMAKKPGSRFATAGEFAADLRRWLRHEPTKARGAWVGRRLLLWGRRNPGWAAAILLAVLTLATVTPLSIYAAERDKNAAQRDAVAAKKEKDAAESVAKAAHEQARDREYELLVQQLQRIRLTAHRDMWRDEAWQRVQTAAKVRTDANLRNEAAATLVGLDVRVEKRFNSFGTSSLAFDAKGERLLIGAGPDIQRRGVGAKVWDVRKADLSEPSGQSKPGPVAFRPDGIPVQLVPKDDQTLELWDVNTGKRLREVTFPAAARKAEMQLARSELDLPLIALSADGSRIAGVAANDKGRGVTVVWDAVNSKQLLEISQPSAAIAFAPSGTLFAAGDREGNVALWSLPNGKSAGNFRVNRLPAYALAFSPDAGADGEGRLRGRLAVGGVGGGLTVWNLKDKWTESICRGSPWDVYAVAFSPDGTILASAGRDSIHLWDAATGSLLVSCPNSDYVTSLAFSADGNLLAAGSLTTTEKGEVVVWRLEDGRGIRTLRGLSQRVISVRRSHDGRRLAALANNWEVGVWDLPSGRLRNVFSIPRGMTADNAGLALSPDGRRLAVVSGRAAKLWEVDSGKEIRAWELPNGLADALAFDSETKLLLFRFEVEAGVCQLRDLLGAEPLKPIATIRDFNARVLDAVPVADGSHVAVIGLSGPGGKERWVRVYDGKTGKELWSEKLAEPSNWSKVTTDPEGKVLVFPPGNNGDRGVLVEMLTGKHLDILAYFPDGLSPGAKYAIRREKDTTTGAEMLTLYRRKDAARLVRFALDVQPTSKQMEFDADGTHVVWGNRDGTVSVCDIPKVQRQLAGLGLGWGE